MIDSVLDGLVALVETLGLALGGEPVPVQKRKHLKRQKGVDPATRVVVMRSPLPETVKRWGGVYDRTTYRARVAVVSPNNDDQSADLPDYSSWRDQLVRLLSKKPADLLGLDGLQDLRARPGDFLPGDKIEEGYDVQWIDVEVSVVRAR